MDVSEKAEELAAHMARQLRLRGGRLAEVATRADRLLPRRLHDDVAYLVEADEMARNPKLSYRVDARRFARAERRLRRFLDAQDPAAARRGEILDRLAAVVFVLFVIVLGLFFLLLSRGYFDWGQPV